MTNLTEVYALRGSDNQPEWHAIVDGIVVPAEFNSRGAALAAISVERARRARRTAVVATVIKPEVPKEPAPTTSLNTDDKQTEELRRRRIAMRTSLAIEGLEFGEAEERLFDKFETANLTPAMRRKYVRAYALSIK